MSKSFRSLYNQLKTLSASFDEVSKANKLKAFQLIHKTPLPAHKDWQDYQNLLLFLAAHPQDEAFSSLVNKETERFSKQIKKASNTTKTQLQNSGLPYTTTLSSFSHDLLTALTEHKEINMAYDSNYEEATELNDVLQFTLPDVEKAATSAGNGQSDLLHELKVKDDKLLLFLLDQFSNLNHEPIIKDYFWNKLGVFIQLNSEDQKFSKLFNKLSFAETFYHSDLLKNFDHRELIETELPYFQHISVDQQDELITVMRNALIFLERETDPTTYIDRRSLRYYPMERGISIAIYTMTPNRQLPLESYVGYTLFKNGYPAAYGGGWVFGKRCLFGINIFEQFRGGESGYFFMQLLRVYKQAFGVEYFEVEPYQYGLDNPEGIESGAFWFYYKFGFRPVDRQLERLAEEEFNKIKTKKGYRSTVKTLTRFTESNIALKLGNNIHESVPELRERITSFIFSNYKSDRTEATFDCLAWFKDKADFLRMSNRYEEVVLKDLSLLARTLNVQSESKFNLLKEMILHKPTDVYTYNELLIEFFAN